MHVKESVRNYNAVSTPASVFEVVNAKNRVLLKEMLFLGGISSTAPSEDDIRLTGIIKSVAVMLEMRLFDHVIVGDNAYCSLKERGLL